jgi:hypothetical protein
MVGEPEFVAVAVWCLHQREVVVESDRPSVIVHSDDQYSSVGVEESCNRLGDGELHAFILGVGVHIPPSG